MSHQATKGQGGPKAHTAERRKPACTGHQLSRDAHYTTPRKSKTTETKPSVAARRQGGKGRRRGGGWGTFRAGKTIVYNSKGWVCDIIHFPKALEHNTETESVNCDLWLTVVCQCWLISVNKSTIWWEMLIFG